MPRRSTRAHLARSSSGHDALRTASRSVRPTTTIATEPERPSRRGGPSKKPSIYNISQQRLDNLLRRAEKERLAQFPGIDNGQRSGLALASRRPAGSRHLTKAERVNATMEGLRSADQLREMNFQAHWEAGAGFEETAGLPDNDLLRAIHYHAAQFYHDQGLMHPKIKRSNERGWYTLRKRRMLSEQGGLADPVPDEDELAPSFDLRQTTRNAAHRLINSPAPDPRGTKRKAGGQGHQAGSGRSPRKEVEVVMPLPRGWSRVPRGSTAGPQEQESGPSSRMVRASREARRDMTDESELDTDGDSEYQGGETDDGDDSDSAREVALDDDDEPDSVVPDVNEDGVDKKRKYRSKQREMHRALDGSALLAIGILLEEHILAQLHQAGYQSEPEVGRSAGAETETIRHRADSLSEDDF